MTPAFMWRVVKLGSWLLAAFLAFGWSQGWLP